MKNQLLPLEQFTTENWQKLKKKVSKNSSGSQFKNFYATKNRMFETLPQMSLKLPHYLEICHFEAISNIKIY